jgi:NAD(P)-dependent dehydrogenase (short-subunit alcohol dehydrogenase family)|tara:strand:- start:14 stop:802 length:789 start_codon:yes stop_codon:yes gene_type:complete
MGEEINMRLENKVALITGAASGIPGELMGFGGACAWRFIEEGAKVMLSDIDGESGRKTLEEFKKLEKDAEFSYLDVTKESNWIEVIDKTITEYGKIDILINCAGTALTKTLDDTSESEWDAQLNVHTKGSFFGIKHVVPHMKANGGGSIVNLSSINGIIGSSSSTAYHVAKGGVRLLTKSAAIQYAEFGIRVNSVHPGYADTPMTDPIFKDSDFADTRLSKVPMGRLGTADEIAMGILYLASDESSFVTGSELVIDGGMTAQ